MSIATLPDDPLLRERFGEIKPPLAPQAALVEAHRCLYCFDAPCTAACPTHIDVPGFIKRIATGNLRGSALRILDANVLGRQLRARLPGRSPVRGCLRHASLQSRPHPDRAAAASRDGCLPCLRRRPAPHCARAARSPRRLHWRGSSLPGVCRRTPPPWRFGHHRRTPRIARRPEHLRRG